VDVCLHVFICVCARSCVCVCVCVCLCVPGVHTPRGSPCVCKGVCILEISRSFTCLRPIASSERIAGVSGVSCVGQTPITSSLPSERHIKPGPSPSPPPGRCLPHPTPHTPWPRGLPPSPRPHPHPSPEGIKVPIWRYAVTARRRVHRSVSLTKRRIEPRRSHACKESR